MTAGLEPRKTPIQARSTASVDAILEATIQVLLKDGKSKLTTVRIAARAGVSVGTLYQYFPNKNALLRALLKSHLDQVAVAVADACAAVCGQTLGEMAEGVAAAFVRAKFQHLDTSAALYAVSDDVEGKVIAQDMHARVIAAMSAMLRTARDGRVASPDVVAATTLSAMAGVSRSMLEGGAAQSDMATLKRELTVLMRAYFEASAGQRRCL